MSPKATANTANSAAPANGSGAAAILSAGIGSFALALFAIAGDKSAAIKTAFVFYKPTGPLSGVTTSAVAVWLLTWAVLEFRWSKRTVALKRIGVAALVLLGLSLLVGMPVFFEVGLVLLLPIVAETARRSGKPPILVALPVLAGLSIVHAVLPPHPAAMLAATQFHADLGRTILYGLAAGLPAAALAGPVLGWFLLRRWERRKAQGTADAAEEEMPLFAPTEVEELEIEHRAEAVKGIPAPAGAMRAAAAILLPVVLICLGSWADVLAAQGGLANQILHFVGSADVALLIAVLAALVTLGSRTPSKGPEGLWKLTAESFTPIAEVLLVLAAAGGLSGILRDSGAAQSTVSLALGAHMPPLVLAWLLAAVVRIAMGSSTVAMAVASAILAPMTARLGVPPELLVLATGTGSLILSHVNDPGFWLIQSFFKLELKETLSTWTVLETVLSVAGLGTTLLLAMALR